MGRIFVLGDEAIERLLHSALVGRIACCATAVDGESRPFLVPLAYAYDGECAYAVSGPGRKIALMRAQSLVSFEVDEVTAEDRWSSVIANGEYEELVSPDQRSYAHELLYGDITDQPPFIESQIVFRLRLTSKTGRFELPDGEEPAREMLDESVVPEPGVTASAALLS